MKRLLIAGCGDLGSRLARRLPAQAWQVTGLRRDPSKLAAPVLPLAADLLDPNTLNAVEGHWDALVYQATPGARNEAAYRRTYIDGLVNVLERVQCDRLIYVSSTAVYGQDQGQWVDELAETRTEAFNGRILKQAEVRALGANTEPVVVRFSGIYGPGREYLIGQVRSGQARCRPRPPQWTNRIHVDDCAGVLAHLLELGEPDAVYCASDPAPAPRCEVLEWLADRLGVPGPQHERADLSAGQGKRVANRRLRDSGFKFRYPDYRSGYGAILS